jgi:hypothetical protein
VRPPAAGAGNESAINLCTHIFVGRYPAVGCAIFVDLSRYLTTTKKNINHDLLKTPSEAGRNFNHLGLCHALTKAVTAS